MDVGEVIVPSEVFPGSRRSAVHGKAFSLRTQLNQATLPMPVMEGCFFTEHTLILHHKTVRNMPCNKCIKERNKENAIQLQFRPLRRCGGFPVSIYSQRVRIKITINTDQKQSSCNGLFLKRLSKIHPSQTPNTSSPEEFYRLCHLQEAPSKGKSR